MLHAALLHFDRWQTCRRRRQELPHQAAVMWRSPSRIMLLTMASLSVWMLCPAMLTCCSTASGEHPSMTLLHCMLCCSGCSQCLMQARNMCDESQVCSDADACLPCAVHKLMQLCLQPSMHVVLPDSQFYASMRQLRTRRCLSCLAAGSPGCS